MQEENTAARPDTAAQEAGRLRGENARLQQELTALKASHEEQLDRLRTESAIHERLVAAGARNPRTVLPLLQLEEIHMENGQLCGLEEQLAGIRAENGYLFSDPKSPRLDSGPRHAQAPGPAQPFTLAGALSEHYR